MAYEQKKRQDFNDKAAGFQWAPKDQAYPGSFAAKLFEKRCFVSVVKANLIQAKWDTDSTDVIAMRTYSSEEAISVPLNKTSV